MEVKCQCLFCSEFSDVILNQSRLAWTTLCRLAFLSIKRKDNNEYLHVRDLSISSMITGKAFLT